MHLNPVKNKGTQGHTLLLLPGIITFKSADLTSVDYVVRITIEHSLR
jgi:hypothetical protein